MGQQFIVRTYQRSLKYLLEQIVDEEYSKWLYKLMGYDFEIQYKPSATNSAVDALSRLPENVTLSQLSAPVLIDFKDLSSHIAADSFLSNIMQSLQQDLASYPHFKLEGSHLQYKGHLALPSDSPHIPWLLHEFHCSSVGEHAGIRHTYAHLVAEFYWKGINRHVQDYVTACDVC